MMPHTRCYLSSNLHDVLARFMHGIQINCGPGCSVEFNWFYACGSRECLFEGASCLADLNCQSRLQMFVQNYVVYPDDLDPSLIRNGLVCWDERCGTNFLNTNFSSVLNSGPAADGTQCLPYDSGGGHETQGSQDADDNTALPVLNTAAEQACAALPSLPNFRRSANASGAASDVGNSQRPGPGTYSIPQLCECLHWLPDAVIQAMFPFPGCMLGPDWASATAIGTARVCEPLRTEVASGEGLCRAACQACDRCTEVAGCTCDRCTLLPSAYIRLDLQGADLYGAEVMSHYAAVKGPEFDCVSRDHDEIPRNFEFPDATERVDFGSNLIATLEPGALTPLAGTALQQLLLDSNRITRIADGAFNTTTGLRLVSVRSNQISVITAGIFAELSRLELLLLDWNRITSIEPASFDALTRLELLTLDNNRLTTFPSEQLVLLSSLLQLDVSRNYIENMGVNYLVPSLPSLQTLDLSENRITSFAVVAFTNAILPNLTALSVHGNLIRGCELYETTARGFENILRCTRCSSGIAATEVPLEVYCPPFALSGGCVSEIEAFRQRLRNASTLLVNRTVKIGGINCPPETMFSDYANLDASGIMLSVQWADGSNVLPSGDFCFDASGSISATLSQAGNYTAVITAHDTTGMTVVMSEWPMLVTYPPVFQRTDRPWPLVLMTSRNRTHDRQDTLLVGESYSISGPDDDLSELSTFFENYEAIAFVLRFPDPAKLPPRGGLLVDTLYGDLLMRIDERGEYAVELVAVDVVLRPGLSRVTDGVHDEVVVFHWEFQVSVQDSADPANGPGEEDCANGQYADVVLFDGDFTCVCGPGEVPPNCRASANTTSPDVPTAGGSNAVATDTAIAVILVSVGFPIIFCAVVVVYQWHQKWSKTRIPHNFGPQLTALARITRDNTGSNILAEGLEVLTPTELNRNLITMTNELGTGEFGVVFKALFKSKNRMTTFEYEVAVKLTKADGETPTDRGRLLDEATVVVQFSHKNVVSLVGVVTVGSPTLLVFQYCAKGSLQQLLRSRRRFPDSNTVQSLLVYASGICDGMAYLATRRFVHRDLAARNILVDSNSTPKISDFGLSRELQMSAYYLTSNEHRDSTKIPVRWTAPEALKSHRFSEKSDVWSFAVVCHEIFTFGQVPYRTWTNAHVIEEVLKGQRLPPPPTMPAVLATQMHQCYLADADERPAFAKLAKLLREIVDAEQDYPDEELDTPRDTDVVAEGFNSAVSPYAVVKLRPRSASLASIGAVDTAGVLLPARSSTCPDTWDDTMSAPCVVTASESQDSGVDAAASPAPIQGYTTGYIQASVIDAAEVLSCTSGPTVTTVHHPFPIAKEAPTETLVNPILFLEGEGGGGLARESPLI